MLSPAKRLYSQLSKLIVLLLVIPATSATAERSFSCVRTLKMYSVSADHHEPTKTEPSIGFACSQDLTDSLDLKAIAQDFVSANDYRGHVFGHF